MKERFIKYSSILYILFILFLGIRPQVPSLYNTFMKGSDIGGFNMYQYYLEEEVNCFFVSEENDTIPINWRQHFYHSTFASSAHPNYLEEASEEFMSFLIEKNNTIKLIQEQKKKGIVYLEIILTKEKRDKEFYNYYKEL